MKAAVFYGKGQLRVTEVPTPTPKPGEVLVRVMACGICGTDVHIFHGDEGAAATPPGTVLGHEFAGVIAAAGPGVTDAAAGDRVCVDPNQLCGRCRFCRGAEGHFCTHMVGIGTTVHGGFAEYCAVPVSQIHRIADTTSFAEAAMAEPLSCCLHGIDLCDVRPADTVLVIGCGMIGLLMIQLAKLAGAAQVIAVEPNETARAHALRLGADCCIDPTRGDPAEALRQFGAPRVTKVIECVGRPETMMQAVDLAGARATVMFFGLTAPAETIAIRPFALFKKELTLKSSYINPYTQQRAVDLIDGKRIDVHSMVTRTAPLAELPEILANPALRRGKVLIRPNE